MATSDKTETNAEISLPKSLLDSLKTKETCPRCKEKFLHTTDVAYALRQRRYIDSGQKDETNAAPNAAPKKNQPEANNQSDSSNSASLEEIMTNVCVRCGHSFYENEQQRERRKEKEKGDKDSNPWDAGLLVLLTMLAVILAINLDRNGADINRDIRVNSEEVIEEQQPTIAPNTNRDGLF